jgi:tetratricopeptide (TPR) repeat protein
MATGPGERYDFFLSRRGSVAGIAREVEQLLAEKGYNVLVQDYDIPFGESFIEKMHEGIKNSRDLIVLYTHDYESSPYTRKEFTSFEAERVKTSEERHIIVLRCEDVPLRGLLADNVYQTLVGIKDPEERKRRIIAAAERRSQAVPPPPRPFIGVPARIASFTGRAKQLDKLDAILMQDKPAAVTQASVGRAAVQGMGGVGKTSLAIEYAQRFRGLYAGVCWCPAETRTGLLSALANLGVTLGAATAEEADVEKAAKAALRRLAEQRATWLLVYDNVPAPDQIVDLLPSAGARVLITSRFSDWSELADEVALDLLPLEEAVALLRTRTGRGYAGAQTLAEALGCLPLALDHAAAYCKRTQMRFADYATKVSSLIDAAPRGVGYLRSVAATFNLAITEAVAQCPAAEALMAYLAQCAPERIPMTLVEGAVDSEAQRMEALAVLAEVSLLRHDPFEDGAPAVTVHRLVQAVARAGSEARGMAQDVAERIIQRLSATYPKLSFSEPTLWPLCAQLTPHLLALGEEASTRTANAEWSDLLMRVGLYVHGRGAYLEAAPFYERAVAIREETLGSGHPETATSLGSLASLVTDLGDLTRAQQLQERALAIREKTLGPEHPDVALSLNQLAIIFRAQGDLPAARRLHERALAIRDKALGSEHPDTATSLNNLAVLIQDQGDLAGARRLLERAVAIREKVSGADHPYTASALNNLARLLKAQGDLLGARPLQERALAIREKVLGPEHPDTATSLNHLARLLHDQGDLAGARTFLERTLMVREKVLGPEHPDTAYTLNSLAGLCRDQGDLVGARPLFERALAIRNRVLGPQHPDTAVCLNNLGLLLQDQGEFEGALTLLDRALAIWEHTLSDEHRSTNLTRSNKARVLLAIGDATEALALGDIALTAHDKTLGRGHDLTKDSARITADALDALGRPDEAKALREQYGVAG